MITILYALAMFLADLFKSRSRLKAENLLLRHQLNVALRQAPPRLRLRGSDRALLVWMIRLWPSLLGALVGRPGQVGTDAIPKEAIAELVSARGIPDLLDTIRVNHVSGGVSIIGLKTYLSGREKFQGETLDFVWFDEEPPADIYTEGLTRTNVGANPVWMTFSHCKAFPRSSNASYTNNQQTVTRSL